MTNAKTSSLTGLKQRRIIGKVAFYVLGLLVAIIVCIPFYWMIITSLKGRGAIMSIPVEWIPKEPTLDAYKKLFAMPEFVGSIFNSFYVSVLCTAVRLLCAAMAAFALTKIPFKGRNAVFGIYVTALMIPSQITFIPLFIIMTNMHLIIAKSKCIPLVITLGTSKMFYGIALTVSGGRIMNFGGAFNGLKTKYFEIFSPMLLVLLAMVMVAYLMMTYTKFGRRVVALGGNEKNAFLSGINVNRYKIIVYGISGLFCAVASIVFVARIDSITSNAGTNYETNALAAAIIGGVTFDGGKGTISGAFLGCLLMGVISNAMNILGVDNNVQTIITGAIIVAAVVLSNINNIKKK